jgi:seryl-tRNA synthetase
VFRHEPSGDPARLQMFHQREIVRLGEPETVAAWRDAWRDRSVTLLGAVGLDVRFDVASDPFFGRSGRLLARSQRAQELKFEVLAQIAGPEPTAVASFNYHQDYFSSTYGIVMDENGGPAHTACLGFGLERITLALLRTHGFDLGAWPESVQRELRIA